ncbi:MAG TPA: ATP-binding protein [Thermoanaerobaculia bacterium]|nr:ATP-binding protein [Thermoanaerobaculia bacterium]HQR66651.1 ATP-binding protein [Thermoanaerobaculia bacterium]
MSRTSGFRGLPLSSRLGLTMVGILVLAALAEALVYLRTRNETLEEADASYQALAKAIELAQTQVGEKGWKDEQVLADLVKTLEARGLRDITVSDEKGQPFPAPSAGKKKARAPRSFLISGVVGEGPTNRTLEIPVVVDGKFMGRIHLDYNLENIRAQLEDNFRRRLFALLGVFAIGIAVLLVLIRNATRPIERLAEGAERVAEGRFDVTVEVDREDEIGQLAAAFNHMTERLRERHVLEARLSAAEKRAEIGQLASGLAHEIKNPLNALSLGLDVLKRRHRPAEDGAGSEYAARIESLREEINRLATLINNFLAFGRPLTITPAPVDVGALLEATLSDLSETAGRAGVTVERRVASDLPPAWVDASLLKSAVWNLVQNAVQAMEAAGGTLRVSAEAGTGPGGRAVTIAVEDTGPGLTPEDLPRLFEPYFSKREGGVGLGLAMVKRIVEEHGGRVAAGNRTDGSEGARFSITLPAAA